MHSTLYIKRKNCIFCDFLYVLISCVCFFFFLHDWQKIEAGKISYFLIIHFLKELLNGSVVEMSYYNLEKRKNNWSESE